MMLNKKIRSLLAVTQQIGFVLLLPASLQAEPVHPRLAPSVADVDGTILEYDPSNGNLRVYQLPESTRPMTTLEIVSESKSLNPSGRIGIGCTLGGLFDVYNPNKLFWLDPAGFNDRTCQDALPTGLSLDFVANDLLVQGSLKEGGALTDVVMLVPEPTGAFTLLCCLAVLLWKRKPS